MRQIVVELIRRFVPVAPPRGDWEFLSDAPAGKSQRWPHLETLHRVLILADPGGGKTFETLDRARRLKARGLKAFFIRIEAIDASFEDAFEVGDAADFDEWMESDEKGWFFLDSVDEAQLGTPRALEDAIRIFGAKLQPARERAHIFITSREDAWQALSDRTLIEQHLPYGAPETEEGSEDLEVRDGADDEAEPSLAIFRLGSLNIDEIRLFAGYHAVSDVPAFVAAIERGNLMSLAERPFDLMALIAVWNVDQALGSRLDVLRRVVELQLASLSTKGASPYIEANKARAGVRSLAAAVTMTSLAKLRCAEGLVAADRIDPGDVLDDWSPEDCDALLLTGLFDDVVYGSVRFRHREIRELLSAEWAKSLLDTPGGRAKVESLFFRSLYGENVMVPRLRPTLAWLLVLDEDVRQQALALEPEIATEGGDPSQLPLSDRRTMLDSIVRRIASEGE